MANLLFVSIETTGLDPAQHGIRDIHMQIGSHKIHSDVRLYKGYDQTLIERGVFTLEDLAKGLPKEEVEVLLSSAFIGEKRQLVVWSAKFAEPFLREFFYSYNKLFHPEVIDVQNLYGFLMRDIRDRLPNFQFNTICKAMGLPQANTPEDKLNNLISLIQEIPTQCILN